MKADEITNGVFVAYKGMELKKRNINKALMSVKPLSAFINSHVRKYNDGSKLIVSYFNQIFTSNPNPIFFAKYYESIYTSINSIPFGSFELANLRELYIYKNYDIAKMYFLEGTNFLKKLNGMISCCGVLYDDYIDDIVAFTSSNGYNRDLYYGFTKRNHELVFSNNAVPLTKLCNVSSINKLEKNTFIRGNKVYSLGNSDDEIGYVNKAEDSIYITSTNHMSNDSDISNIDTCNEDNFKKGLVNLIDSRNGNRKNKYGIYLTDKDYKFNPAILRETEIRSLEKKLLIPGKGVILVGKPGVGKTSIVEGLSYKIQTGNVCNALKNKDILSVSVSSLVSGCKYRGTFEEKVEGLCNSLIDTNGQTILFLDEIHTALGVGAAEESNIDLAAILKTYISNDLIKVIGCTTNEDYGYFSDDKAFRRRFNLVEVGELSKEAIKEILKTNMYNNPYNIEINMTDIEVEKLLQLIIKLSNRKQKYTGLTQSNLDVSINILIESLAYMALDDMPVATLNDFILGIKDNDSLNLSDLDNLVLFKNFDNNCDCNEEKTHIKVLTNKDVMV